MQGNFVSFLHRGFLEQILELGELLLVVTALLVVDGIIQAAPERDEHALPTGRRQKLGTPEALLSSGYRKNTFLRSRYPTLAAEYGNCRYLSWPCR